MTLNEFLKHGTHFINFPQEQLQEMFDEDEIAKIPNVSLYQNSAFMLSQLLIGNVVEPLEELQAMERVNRVRVLEMWVDVLNDQAQLEHVARFMINLV